MMVKSLSGAVRAPCPADAPSTRHHRNPPRQVGQQQQIVRPAPSPAAFATRVGEAMARAVEHEDERDALLVGDLADPGALGRGAGADGSPEHREVLRTGQHHAAMHTTAPGNQRVSRSPLAADERAELDEGPRVEKQLEPLARVELPAGVHEPLDALRSPHGARRGPPLLELLQDGSPAIAIVGHLSLSIFRGCLPDRMPDPDTPRGTLGRGHPSRRS